MGDNVIHVSQADFEELVMKSDIPVVVDFWAPWCGPCRSIGPILDELALKHAGKVKVAKGNVDKEPALASTFQVKGIPMLIAIQNEKIVHHAVGFGGRQPLEDLFEKLAGDT